MKNDDTLIFTIDNIKSLSKRTWDALVNIGKNCGSETIVIKDNIMDERGEGQDRDYLDLYRVLANSWTLKRVILHNLIVNEAFIKSFVTALRETGKNGITELFFNIPLAGIAPSSDENTKKDEKNKDIPRIIDDLRALLQSLKNLRSVTFGNLQSHHRKSQSAHKDSLTYNRRPKALHQSSKASHQISQAIRQK
eukprot:TRINITY_DN6623_c0_g2_i18.p1 TRINITY_DN6623_c0_g2~~TRINITY_DN6623_c0_g2_i18.p1  ORF type:complete len:194 (+),score=17.96 TRINITY_DN6623_c0_g2_i18:152-733(+)